MKLEVYVFAVVSFLSYEPASLGMAFGEGGQTPFLRYTVNPNIRDIILFVYFSMRFQLNDTM